MAKNPRFFAGIDRRPINLRYTGAPPAGAPMWRPGSNPALSQVAPPQGAPPL